MPSVSDLWDAQKTAQMTSPGGKGFCQSAVDVVTKKSAAMKRPWSATTTTAVAAMAARLWACFPAAAPKESQNVV